MIDLTVVDNHWTDSLIGGGHTKACILSRRTRKRTGLSCRQDAEMYRSTEYRRIKDLSPSQGRIKDHSPSQGRIKDLSPLWRLLLKVSERSTKFYYKIQESTALKNTEGSKISLPHRGGSKISLHYEDCCWRLVWGAQSSIVRFRKVQLYRIQEDPGSHSLTKESIQRSLSLKKTAVLGMCQDFKT